MKKEETEVLGELASIRCHRLVICEEADNKIGSADFVFELKSKLSEYTRDLLMIPILHELGFYMSVPKGFRQGQQGFSPRCERLRLRLPREYRGFAMNYPRRANNS